MGKGGGGAMFNDVFSSAAVIVERAEVYVPAAEGDDYPSVCRHG